ncbi:MAG: TldD/PmbA family protein [Candidatus Bathyarchaeota archaeon]|nr:TldD/PmbA family protein [Candidatus Bathyarchaeota archaeon]
MDEKKLLELSGYIVSKGQRLGASDVEVLSRSTSEIDVIVKSGEISGVEKRLSDGIAIRLYIGKRMGSAFTNIPTTEAADEALAMALASAKVTTEDPDWVALPEPKDYPTINGLWNEDIARCEPSKAVEIAEDFRRRATEAEEGLIVAYGGSGISLYHTALANSRGISHSERGNIAYAYLGAIAQIEQGVTPMVFSVDVKRHIDLDLKSAVDDIASLLRVCKNTVDGKSGKHTVVMHPWAYSQILSYTLFQAVRGDNVARGKSKLNRRIGETIAADNLTIVDDGTIPTGINSSLADDEGVPRRRTTIIKEGVLKSFLWDTYWGNKTGEESTGNSRRRMRQGLVEIGSTNTVVEPGKRDIRDIVSEIDHGYLIRNVQGAHSSNPESGDFSVVGNPAILIEEGEMAGAVHGLMISGNTFDLLSKCVEVAKETIPLQGLIGPEIVFDDVNVISRR